MQTHNENMRIKFVTWLKQTFILFVCLETKNKQSILLWPNNQCLPKFNKNAQQIYRIESNQLLSTDLFVQIQYIYSFSLHFDQQLFELMCNQSLCSRWGKVVSFNRLIVIFIYKWTVHWILHCILKSWKWDRRRKKRENRQIITENPVRWQFSLIYSDRLAT